MINSLTLVPNKREDERTQGIINSPIVSPLDKELEWEIR